MSQLLDALGVIPRFPRGIPCYRRPEWSDPPDEATAEECATACRNHCPALADCATQLATVGREERQWSVWAGQFFPRKQWRV